MLHFRWEEKYSVGNQEIDDQHKRLFELGNGISEISSGQDVKRIIKELFKYTREHFAAEESMMMKTSFPLFDEHRQMHEDLITQLRELSSRPFDTSEAILEFKKFLFQWLTNHVMTDDNKYFEFIHNQE